jgi:hypothetical protein
MDICIFMPDPYLKGDLEITMVRYAANQLP